MNELLKNAASILMMLAVCTTAFIGPIAADAGVVGTAEARHQCNLGDSMTVALLNSGNGDASYFGQDCTMFHGDTTVSSGLDKAQAKESLSTAAANSAEHSDLYKSSLSNTLQVTETVARSEALAAYYRALENGSTQSAAKTRARTAVQDYYARMQYQLVQGWQLYANAWLDYENRSDAENINDDYVRMQNTAGSGAWTQLVDNGNISKTAVNGTMQITATEIQVTDSALSSHTVGPWGSSAIGHFEVGTVNDTFASVNGPAVNSFHDRWLDIEDQSSSVVSNIETYVDNTYSEYEAGEVNTTDIAGANALAREFAAEGQFDNWAALKLSMLEGADMPKNLSRVGYYNVSHDGHDYQGVLLSDGNPPSGSFERGATYNGSNLTGPQKLVTDDTGVRDLDGQFTITDIRDNEGNVVNKTVIRNINYSTTNTTDYVQLLEEMQKLRAEYEAREEKQRGGGAWDLGNIGLGGTGLALVALGIVLLILLNESDGGPTIVERQN